MFAYNKTAVEDWHSEECKLTPTCSTNLYTKIKNRNKQSLLQRDLILIAVRYSGALNITALELIFNEMCYINLLFTYLLTIMQMTN